MFKITYQGQQAFALAKNISNKYKRSIIETQDLVAALAETNDSSAGKILFDRYVTRFDIQREIAAAQSVTAHSQDDPSLVYAGMNDSQAFENKIKSNPVPFIKEPGNNPVTIIDREYHVSDYVLHGLNYAQALLQQRNTTKIETQDLLLGMVDVQDSNAFWLLLKLLIMRMHGFYANAYTNVVLSKLDLDWYRDGYETNRRKQKKALAAQLVNKLTNPDYSILKEYGRDLTQLAREKKLAPVVGRDDEIKHLALVLNRRQKSNALLIGPAGVGKTAIAEGLAQRIATGHLPTLKAKRLIALDPDRFATLMARAASAEVISHLLAELTQRQDIILFIDEVQVLRHRGGLGLFDMLKPALARGELQLIGATTPMEAQEFFDNDTALQRRFATIMVKPLTRSQADQVVATASIPYENFYRANYTTAAKLTAVDLASAYLATPLPDAALTILDNAGALVTAHTGTTTPDSQGYIQQLQTLENQLATARTKSLNEDQVHQLKQAISDLQARYAVQKANGDQKQYTAKITEQAVIKATAGILGRSLSKQDVRIAKQRRTAESLSIFKLEKHLQDHIIGQNQAVSELSQAIMIAKAGLRKMGAPIGSFFFAGLTGTGKTETAKQLAIAEFGSDQNLLRFNMPDFNGFGGQDLFVTSLLQQVTAHPNAVILLDEIEKAKPALDHILLSIMDEGVLLPNFNLNPDFSKSIIIMTSNIGAAQLSEQHVGFTSASANDNQSSYDTVRQAMQKRFAPEFLNRLTKIIVFNRLQSSDLSKIANLLLENKQRLLLEKDVHLVWDQSLPDYIVARYADPNAGARPLERGIDQTIMSPLAVKLLKHEILPGQTIKLSVANEQLSIEVA